MTIATIPATTEVLTADQAEILEELEAMNMFKNNNTYLWYIKQLEGEGIETLEQFNDLYAGCFDGSVENTAGAEFAQNLAEECGEVPTMSSWIEIDWRQSWDNLKYDYFSIEIPAESGHGYIQETHFFRSY